MLASLLKATPWGAPFESHFIPKYFAEGVAARLEDRATFKALAARILAERPIAQHRLDITPDELYESMPTHDYASLADAVGRACRRNRGGVSWGDKTPHYINHVDLLHTLFPRSKMIYIVRDGRDVAVSLLKKPWGPANAYACALKWHHENRLQPILDTLRTSGLLYDLRYEDLLHAPADTLSAVYTFLQVDIPGDELTRLAATVRQGNSGSWRRELTPAQARVFEQLAGSTLQRFGYGVSHGPRAVGLTERLGYVAQDQWKHAVNLFRMNVIDTVRIRFFNMDPFGQ
jgi:hypothetical protein